MTYVFKSYELLVVTKIACFVSIISKLNTLSTYFPSFRVSTLITIFDLNLFRIVPMLVTCQITLELTFSN